MPDLLKTMRFSSRVLLTFHRNYSAEKFMWSQTKYRPPKAVLANYEEMPIIGLGTWQIRKTNAPDAIKTAIKAGYRHFDCAHVHENEAEIGTGLDCAMNNGLVKRGDIFVTSKLWNTFHRPDLVQEAFANSLDALRLDYLDLYLMHWPMAYKEGCSLFPVDSCGNLQFSDVDYVDTWRAMEKLVRCGVVKSIGVANFNCLQLKRLISCCQIKPVVNQIESHPYLNNKETIKFCKCLDISVTTFSPLGSPSRPWAKDDDAKVLCDETIQEIAKCKKKTPNQILIRYQVQQGNVCIPKSVNKEHMESNYNVFDFKLEDDEMCKIDQLDCGKRYISLLKEAGEHKYYPFK